MLKYFLTLKFFYIVKFRFFSFMVSMFYVLLQKPRVFGLFFEDLFIYLRQRECVHVQLGEGRGRESQDDSLLSVKPDVGLDLTTPGS